MSYMLLLLLHAVPPSILPKGIRAVATHLECKENACSTDDIATAVLCKIDPVLESMGQAADQTKGAASDARKAADQLYRMGEEIRDKLKKGMEMAKDDIQRVTEVLKDEMTKLNEVAAKALSRINLARNNIQLPTPHLSPYLNTDSLFAHGFPSLTPTIIIRTAFDT